MGSVVLSVIFCTLCIHQGYPLSVPEPVPDVYKNHAACLTEQNLDLSVFSVSRWSDLDEDDHLDSLKTLEESKRNVLLACLLHHKPIYDRDIQYIRKNDDGTYEFHEDLKFDMKARGKTCKEYERDLNKLAGCYYNSTRIRKYYDNKSM